MEIRPIPSAPGYFANSNGEILSALSGKKDSGKLLVRKLWADKDGYLCVVLRIDKKSRNKRVATLVAEAFNGPRPAGMTVAHDDGVCTNNTPKNLIYKTYPEQAEDKERHGTMIRGDLSHLAKFTDELWVNLLKDLNGGMAKRHAANKYGVALSSIYAVLSGRVRKHLTNRQPLAVSISPG